MRRDRRQLCVGLVGSVGGLAWLPGLAADVAAPVSWRLASGYSPEVFQTRNLAQFADDAGAASGGRLRLQLHANNSLVKLADIARAVGTGQVEAGEVIMSGLVKDIPAAGADAVPFIIGSHDDARRLWQHQRPVLEEALAARGLQALYAVPWPSQGLFSTRPVASTLDLRGSRMRTYNEATVRLAQLLGATPVDVPMTGVAAALREGRIDTMITSGVTGVDNQVWTQLKYFYDIRAWYPKNLVLVNRHAWAALDAPLRDALDRAAAQAEQRGWALSQAAAAESLATLARHGLHVETPGPELRSELRRLGERFSIEWVRATGRDANRILIPYYGAPVR